MIYNSRKLEGELYKPREIFPGLFQLRIPLPFSPLGHLNSYLIRAEDQCLLIDTGMCSDEAFNELRRQLAEIEVEPENLTKILVPHLHIDHVGLVPRLRRLSGAELMVSEKEAEAARLISTGKTFWKVMKSFFEEAGVPKEVLKRMLRASPARSHLAIYEELGKPSKSLEDGERISIGEYSFLAILTPGHSPGHICLYEPDRRILLAGDHLLPTITPHVTWLGGEDNPLSDYLNSLEKVGKLSVDVVLPGHEEPFKNRHRRIRELKEHHRSRVAEIISELQKEGLTAYQIASKIHWDVHYPSFDRFPAFQKYLAVGETLAHLRFLEERKRVRRDKRAKTVIYHAG